ncbi:ATP-binding protein [Acinetobacter radioresistens]|uniref:ATP-binding protein n=1 Tax=Acinetobacter radioresistens TaxID=40216 RepID=UPI002005C8DB|nr:ATP-binding protein [Acinetobacter radioresistens]MCK4099763.1 ATP-binding protein [Acinetobacter radioresistens]
MNAMHTQFQQTIQLSSEFCSKHSEAMVTMFGRSVCKSCAVEAVTKAQDEHAHSVNQMVREKHFAGAMLPKRHAESGFLNYQVSNDGQKTAKHQCATFAKDFNKGVQRNLIMVGRTGTGKTHLACAVARNVLDKQKYARYVTSEDMANEIANAWKKTDDNESNAVFRFAEYDLLILDEYGLNDQHENRLKLVHKVLYARYDEAKPTMLISNWTIKQLEENLGDRLWSRFQHGGLTVVQCNWADARLGGAL